MKLQKSGIQWETKMAIIDMIRRMGEKKAATKEKFKQLQEDDKLQHILQERKKSSNRRELEKHFEQEEEKEIKKQLDKIRMKQQSDFFSSKENSILGQKTTMLNENKKLFKGKGTMLDQKNIFMDNENSPFNKKKGMSSNFGSMRNTMGVSRMGVSAMGAIR